MSDGIHCRFHHHQGRWFAGETILLISFAWWLATPSGQTQDPEPLSLLASLSMSSQPPRFRPVNVQEATDRQIDRAPEPVLRHRKSRNNEAWDRFEADFAPVPHQDAPVRRQLASAKYGLDLTVFATDRFLKNIREQMDFEFDRGQLQRTVFDTPSKSRPRVKLDLELLGGQPYIGTRLVIPFGK